MPYLHAGLIRRLCTLDETADAVVPLNREDLREPLHAVYSRATLPAMSAAIAANDRSILNLLDRIKTQTVGLEKTGGSREEEKSFLNVNTQEEYEKVTKSH
jgi:molybdopterin-guanine dinucleotide biosynthesis protein A